tara:strand:- start:138 stop:623 length:486 start_codon:yes stop_codon:yes gene_type:complete
LLRAGDSWSSLVLFATLCKLLIIFPPSLDVKFPVIFATRKTWRLFGDSGSGFGGLETFWRIRFWIGRCGDSLETPALDLGSGDFLETPSLDLGSGDFLETPVLDLGVWRLFGDSGSGLGGLETQVLDWEVWRLFGDSGSGLGGLETDWRLRFWIEGILKEI